ncbi:MAG: DNA translocase FtsK 4TM domain-containing protein [Lachnospiraceae bacterium]|nr:DNA translocase FtsK 4TM domain-containing protein [Lachnospiraceae bacterium]
MATNSTKKAAGSKNATAKKTTEKKTTGAKGAGTKTGGKAAVKSASKTKTAEPMPKEELVPELSNELVLLITLVVSVLLFLSNFSLSGKVGEVINQVTFGLFGILAYIIPFFLFFGIAFYLANKEGSRRYVTKLVASIGLFAIVAAVIQLVFGKTTGVEFMEYYKSCAETKSGGGLLGGALCWVMTPLFGKVGTYVVLIALALLCIMILTGKALFALLAEISGKEFEKQKELYKIRSEERKVMREEQRMLKEEQLLQREEQLRVRMEEQEVNRSKAQSFLLPKEEPKEEQPKRELKRNFFGGFSSTDPAGNVEEVAQNNESTTVEKTSAMQELEQLDKETEELIYTGNFQPSKDTVDTVNSIYEEELRKKFDHAGQNMSIQKVTPVREVIPVSEASYMREVAPVEEVIPETKPFIWPAKEPELPKNPEPRSEEPFEPSFSEQALLDKRQPESPVAKEAFAHAAYGVPGKKITEDKKEMEEIKAANKPTAEDIAQVAEEAEAAQEELIPEYQFPPVELLSKPVVKNTGNAEEELRQTAEKLRSTLESFGVRVTINNASRGPAVTRYELQPEQGVKVSKITGLADDIKLNLAAADVRIEAPIPGKAAVGIEVPNKENTAVMLRELIESPEFVNHGSNIAFTVGKDIGGQNIVADIGKMPHLLIAGSTGSGKSVCINTIIMSILYKAHPNDVKLIMVDPKVVELSVYNGIPHLLIPVVTDPKKASAALNWAVTEMLERYDKFAALSVRDLKGYNERVEEAAKEGHVDERFPRLPQIVIIVDELADLMMVAPGEVEDAICRLAQMARAAGLHLILATQRPSVNVITGLIKANVPSRVAFAVSSGVDSRTILDSVGAEKLLGKGDMLFFPSGYPKPVRIQGAFVSDKEVSQVVEFLKGQNAGTAGYSEEITKKIANGVAAEAAGGPAAAGTADNGKDEYFAEAGRFIIEKDKASIGMLQRVYKIGFNRAARIMDQLSDAGVVGPEEGTKPRKILMTMEEFENYLTGGE